MRVPWGRVKPGWYVFAALIVYAAVATAQWRTAASALREARLESVSVATASLPLPPPPDPTPRATGLWFPIPGARLPNDDTHLPNAERAYRAGVSEGFSFWPDSSGVPIHYGTPVIAVGDGVVRRADEPYAELSLAEWNDLLLRVADGADARDLDQLRGRQVWIELDDGRVVRYGHLSSVRAGISAGTRVERGRVIAAVGNSGTGDGVAGRTSNARLHFEIWDGDTYVGQELSPVEVRVAAASLFTGP
jgi:murein DD-endopeptidase MepM/ murein hydrolase activator NlpD